MKPFHYLLIILIYFIVQFAVSCNTNSKKAGKEEGKKLAYTYCITCHSFPDPSLLDKKTWSEGVLPRMAELMYVETYYNPYDPSGPDGNMPETRAAPKNLFPSDKWEEIAAYYLSTAPDKHMERTEKIPPIHMELPIFQTHSVYDLVENPLTTYVNIDTVAKKIIVGDGAAQKVFILNNKLKVIVSMSVPLGVTDINHTLNGIEAITMGILKPSDEKLGKLSIIANGKDPVTVIDSLRRPVQATYFDVNADGKEDIIISEFGFRKGSLSWFENKSDGKYEQHLLKALPGGISSKVYDFNKDGRPDIVAMMAQGDEAVFIFYNEGNGKFREQRVLQFSPVYGSNHFELVDINKDGYIDIITTNGDNGDLSIIVKAYHGIRIFLNDGKNNFTEKAFLPVNGVWKVVAADFDDDGDIDLASIAFSPDYDHLPEESFIYFENKGNLSFDRFSFPGATDGRWMTMDAADMDGDGDIDIVLGGAFFIMGNVPKEYIEKWRKRPVSIILLENTINKNKLLPNK